MNEFDGEFGVAVQQILLSHLIDDSDVFVRCRNIIQDTYFDDHLRRAVRFILAHADEHKAVPSPALIQAKTGIEIRTLRDMNSVMDADWFLTELERFCRYKALESVILDGYDLIQKGQYANIEERVKGAMTISLVSDLGTNYFENPKERLRRMLDRSSRISTGWNTLDHKLNGGFERGGLNLFSGGAGSGKSLFLQNLALNWSLAGFVTVYFTLELGSDLVAHRLDAMLTGKGTADVARTVDDTSLMVAMKGKKAAPLVIKKMPEGGTCANDFRAYLKEFQIKMGVKADCVVVDYLDLMYPNNQKMDMSNLFVKDKYVAEELRGMMHETNTFGASASQLNRGSVAAEGEFDQSHIAGGISKVNTADNLMAIYTHPGMRERGEYELTFLKTRTSSAVGQKIKLKYNSVSMKISDLEPTEDVDKPTNREELKASAREKPETKAETGGKVSTMMVQPKAGVGLVARLKDRGPKSLGDGLL